ncbi:MAG: RDD family protein [Actinomycetota bacterium]
MSPQQGSPMPRHGDAVHPKVDAVPREARPFQGQRAGVVTRTAANVLDFLLVAGVLACGYAAWCAVTFLVNPARFSFPTVSFFVLLVCAGVVLFTYFTVSWASTGRTFGDHQLGLRVVNPRGDPLRWPGAVIRAAFCVLLPIGLYWVVLSPTNRSVQDSVLRTSVIYDWTVRRHRPPRVTKPG